MSPIIDYHRSSPKQLPWWYARALEWLIGISMAASLYCGLLSVIYSHMLATPTPQYNQYKQSIQAQAATLPAGSNVVWPPFTGQTSVPKPLYTLPTTYFALFFAVASIALIVVSARLSRRAKV